ALDCACQLWPSQCSISVRGMPFVLHVPTAHALFARSAATSASPLWSPTFGLGWIAQRDPFHRSTRVRAPPSEDPTVQAFPADVTATAASRLPPLPSLGEGWMLHRDPSDRRTRVRLDAPA